MTDEKCARAVHFLNEVQALCSSYGMTLSGDYNVPVEVGVLEVAPLNGVGIPLAFVSFPFEGAGIRTVFWKEV